MKTSVIAAFCVILFTLLANNCYAQLAARVFGTSFKRFDANQSGWLSGKELTACNCTQYDTNADNEVTLEEFFIGKGMTKQEAKKYSSAINPTAVQPASPVTAKPAAANPVQQKTTGTGTPNIRGAWSYVGFIEKGGKITRMSSRMSSLNLGADGKFEVNTWMGGSNNMRQVGTYTLSGNRLTMITSGGEVRKYTLSFSADGEMSMTNEKGEGFVAAR